MYLGYPRILSSLLATSLLLSLAGCGTPAPDTPATGSSSPTVSEKGAESDYRIVTDMAGRQVEVPLEVEKVMTLHPVPTYCAWRLGGEKLINVDANFSKLYSAEDAISAVDYYTQDALSFLRTLPVTDTWMTGIDPEVVLELEPDLILTLTQDSNADKLQEETGIPVFCIVKAPVTEQADSYRLVGEPLGNEALGNEMADFVQGILDRMDAEVSQMEESDQVRVMFCGKSENLYGVPGADSIYATTLEAAGGINVSNDHGCLILKHLPQCSGEFVTPVGGQLQKGALLVRAGDILTPLLLSRLASGGYNRIKVLRRPVVAFIPTGNELVPAGTPVPAGKNVDSNSVMAGAKITAWGGKPLLYPIQPDNLQQLIHTLQDALGQSDIVIINAGSSKGTADFSIPALESVGTILSHMITSGPGAHTSCTITPDGKPIVGIPGPSVGAECTMDWFVKPLMDRYLGQTTQPIKVLAIYQGNDYPATGRMFSLVRRAFLIRQPDERLFAVPVDIGDSRGMDRCNGFITLPPAGLKRGTEIQAELRYPYQFL